MTNSQQTDVCAYTGDNILIVEAVLFLACPQLKGTGRKHMHVSLLVVYLLSSILLQVLVNCNSLAILTAKATLN